MYIHVHVYTQTKSVHFPTEQNEYVTILHGLDTVHFPQGVLHIIHAFIHTEHPSVTCIYPLKTHLQQRHVNVTLC